MSTRARPWTLIPGIGLLLVKRICDRQRWQIELESREGGGTTAVLRFFPAP